DIAQFLDEHDADTDWRVLNLLDIGRQAEILGYLDRKQQVALARSAPRARLAAVVSEMDADDRADLFNALTEDEQEALLPALAQA
ncbi:magnesium transporter MgtE N-terminal domain-containing protein, partial [Xanthomonas translucens pv. undulosa]